MTNLLNIENYPITVQPLLQLLNAVHPLTPAIAEYLSLHVEHAQAFAGELLEEAGKPSKYTYFINKGAVRGYIREDNKDITTWISIDGEMVTSISGIDGQSNALENIHAVEDCKLLRISNQAIQELYEKELYFNIVGRKILQAYYRDAEKRAFVVRLSTAENKYLFFLDHYGHLANRIQLQYIASFLGITMETLSRVRRKISFS